MAGEKLSPRQKMIGVMYLVLTALLALQVSSSVLDKFILINKSLEKGIQKQISDNNARLKQINTLVEDMGYREKDVKILTQAKLIRNETGTIVSYINQLKEELIEKTGGKDPETGKVKGVKDDGVVSKIMLTEKKADELQLLLNGYMQFLTTTIGKKYNPIALDAKDSELFRDDPNQHDKDFGQLNFLKTPLGAVLATLTQFLTEIVYSEADALDTLSDQIGAGDVKFDSIVPLVKPQSNIVAAGSMYDAELLVAASSSSIEPEMDIDGRKIPVAAGVGKISFLATPGSYDKNGLVRKTFNAKIRLKTPGGGFSDITKEVEYFVAKPIIQLQSAAVSALYLNAGNELIIQVPALGVNYNPTFKAEGATVLPGQGKGLVTLIPNKAEVKLSVYNNNNFLDTITFKVRTIPKPVINITSGGKVIDERQGVPAPGPRKLEISVVPDESFSTFLPKDARYRVAAWEVTLARGSRPIKTKTVTAEQTISLGDFAALAQPGDRIVIEVKKVERLNYKNKIETVNIGTVVHTIPIN